MIKSGQFNKPNEFAIIDKIITVNLAECLLKTLCVCLSLSGYIFYLLPEDK